MRAWAPVRHRGWRRVASDIPRPRMNNASRDPAGTRRFTPGPRVFRARTGALPSVRRRGYRKRIRAPVSRTRMHGWRTVHAALPRLPPPPPRHGVALRTAAHIRLGLRKRRYASGAIHHTLSLGMPNLNMLRSRGQPVQRGRNTKKRSPSRTPLTFQGRSSQQQRRQ